MHSQSQSYNRLKKKFQSELLVTRPPSVVAMRQRRQEMGKEPSSALSGRAVTASTARVLPVPLTAPAPDPIGLKKLQLATKSPVGALQKRTTMGLGDYSHCRQRMSRGLYGVSGRAALWSPVFHPVHRMPCGTWRIDALLYQLNELILPKLIREYREMAAYTIKENMGDMHLILLIYANFSS